MNTKATVTPAAVTGDEKRSIGRKARVRTQMILRKYAGMGITAAGKYASTVLSFHQVFVSRCLGLCRLGMCC